MVLNHSAFVVIHSCGQQGSGEAQKSDETVGPCQQCLYIILKIFSFVDGIKSF